VTDLDLCIGKERRHQALQLVGVTNVLSAVTADEQSCDPMLSFDQSRIDGDQASAGFEDAMGELEQLGDRVVAHVVEHPYRHRHRSISAGCLEVLCRSCDECAPITESCLSVIDVSLARIETDVVEPREMFDDVCGSAADVNDTVGGAEIEDVIDQDLAELVGSDEALSKPVDRCEREDRSPAGGPFGWSGRCRCRCRCIGCLGGGVRSGRHHGPLHQTRPVEAWVESGGERSGVLAG
jgi:hypothetical protein